MSSQLLNCSSRTCIYLYFLLKCEKKPRDVCGPGPCPLVKSADSSCRTVVETVVHDVPEEKCDLVPKKDCKFITKQIP